MRKNAEIFKKYKNTQDFWGIWVFLGKGMVIFGYLGLGIYQKPNPKPNKYPTKLTYLDHHGQSQKLQYFEPAEQSQIHGTLM